MSERQKPKLVKSDRGPAAGGGKPGDHPRSGGKPSVGRASDGGRNAGRPHLVQSGGGPSGRSGGEAGEPVSNAQRALWTFLLTTLAGPFFAALAVFLLAVGAGAMQVGPPSLKGLAVADVAARAASWAVASFVWAAVPAGVAGLVMAGWVALRGTLPWLGAVVVAGVAASIAATVTGGVARDHLTAIAVIAGLAALAVWAVLRRARVVG